MTCEQELLFFNRWTKKQKEQLEDFNDKYEKGVDVSNHPLVNSPTPTRR